jgi:hypothetical protein
VRPEASCFNPSKKTTHQEALPLLPADESRLPAARQRPPEPTFREQWQGKGFTRLRSEMREVLLRGGRMFWRKQRFRNVGACAHLCVLNWM